MSELLQSFELCLKTRLETLHARMVMQQGRTPSLTTNSSLEGLTTPDYSCKGRGCNVLTLTKICTIGTKIERSNMSHVHVLYYTSTHRGLIMEAWLHVSICIVHVAVHNIVPCVCTGKFLVHNYTSHATIMCLCVIMCVL